MSSAPAANPAQEPTSSFLPLDCPPDSDGVRAHAWSPDGATVLVAHERTGDVTFVARELEARVDVGSGPMDIEVSASLGLAVVPLAEDDALALVDIAGQLLAATVALSGELPYQVELSSDGTFAVVACADSDTISIVDLVARAEVGSFPTVDQGPHSPGIGSTPPAYGLPTIYPTFDLAPDDLTVVVPSPPEGLVAAYELATGTKIAELGGHWDPRAVAVGPSGRYVATLDGEIGFVRVLDLLTNTGLEYDPCPWGPSEACLWGTTAQSLAVHPTAEVAYFASVDHLLVLDLATATPIADIPAGGATLALSSDGSLAYTAGASYGAGIQVADTTTLQPLARLEDVRADQLVPHPTSPRVSTLEWLQAERVSWVDFVGNDLVVVSDSSTGSDPEGDSPCWLATDDLGRVAVSANFRSNTVTILDVESGGTTCLETGDRPFVVELDGAGTVAVVGHLTGPAAVVDLENRGVVAQLDAPGAHVGVERDGSRAYVLDVQGKALRIVQLAGAGSHVTATIPLDGLAYVTADRTIAMRGDGLIAVPQWTEGLVTLIDGIQGEIVKRIEVLGYPAQVEFGPEGQFAYASTGSSIYRIVIDGEDSHKAGKVNVLNQSAGRMLVSDDGRRLFTVNGYSNPATLVVVDTTTMKKEHILDLPPLPDLIALGGSNLFAWTRYGTELLRIHVDDSGAAIVGTLPVSSRPLQLFGAPDGVLYSVASLQDGLDAFDFVEDVRYCSPAVPNSTGRSGSIHALGWPEVGGTFRLRAEGLPPGRLATFLVGDARGKVPFAGGGQGTLCVVGSVGRFEPALLVGPDGAAEVEVDADALPQPGAPVAVQPGETWHFQTWFLDSNPGPTSNLTDAVSITFR